MIYIPYNTPSSKNSKFITKDGKIINSELVRKWYSKTVPYWLNNKVQFLLQLKDKQPPYHIVFYFVRDSKRKFVYINALQVIQDAMQKYGWLENDNCDNIIPYFMPYKVDKTKAGCYLYIINPINIEEYVDATISK